MEDNPEIKVHRMQDDFLLRWGAQFPHTPPPPIRALSGLREADDRESSTVKASSGVPFDKWLSSGAVDQLRNSYRCTEEKIAQLEDQLSRKVYLREFLAQLLEYLDPSGCASPKPSPDKFSTNIGDVSGNRRASFDNKSSTSSNVENVKPSSEKSSTDDNHSLDSKRRRFYNNASARVATDETGTSVNKTTNVGEISASRRPGPSANSQQVGLSGEVKGHTGATIRRKQHESTAEGRASIIQAEQTTLSPCINLGRGVTSQHGECAGSVTRERDTGNTTCNTASSDLKYTATLKARSAETCEYSAQRGARLGPCFDKHNPDYQGVSVNSVTSTKTTTCSATQTDLSAGYLPASKVSGAAGYFTLDSKHYRLTQVADASTNTTAMFWNRKKSSAKKPEEQSGRDNSGILGRYSTTGDPLVPPPPRPEEAPRNVQYLKLTDGFNFVLQETKNGAGNNTSSASQKPQAKNEPTGELQRLQHENTQFHDDEGVYDNNSTLPSRAQWYAVSSLGGRGEKSRGKEVSCETDFSELETRNQSGSIDKSQSSVTKSAAADLDSPTGSSSPNPPSRAPRVPVTRVSSDTTGLRSSGLEKVSPAGSFSPKPQPRPRHKIPPPLPAKQRPASSVFYVDSSTAQGNVVHANQDNATRGKGSGQEPSGRASPSPLPPVMEDTCVDSRRGHLDTITSGVLHREKHTTDTHASGSWGADDRAGTQLETDVSQAQRAPEGFDIRATSSTFGARKPEREINQRGSGLESTAHAQTHSLLHGDTDLIDILSQRVTESSDQTETVELRKSEAEVSEKLNQRETEVAESVDKRSSVAELSERFNQRNADRFQQGRASGINQRDTEITSRVRQHQQLTGDPLWRISHSPPDSANRELCRTSVLGATGFNQYLASKQSDSGNIADVAGSGGSIASDENRLDVSGGGYDEEMLRFNRHTLQQRNSNGAEFEDTPAVYRKTEYDSTLPRNKEHSVHADKAGAKHGSRDAAAAMDSRRNSDSPHTEASKTEDPTTPTPQTYDEPPTPQTYDEPPTFTPQYDETDIDAAFEEQPVLRPERLCQPAPPVPEKPKKKPRDVTEYENWTINRAVTQQVDSNSDGDDEDSDNASNASPGGTLDRLSAKGSKDSGLCLDPPSSSSSSDVPSAMKGGCLVESRGKEFKSSLDELAQFQGDDEEYVGNFPYKDTDDGNNGDDVSIASDIIFMHGFDVTADSPVIGKREHDHALGLSSEDDEDRDSPPSVDTSYDDADGDLVSQPPSPRDNMLKMRHLLIVGVLETERGYVAILELLLHYKRTLEASCKTSQPVISEDSINAIFGNLQDVYQIHTEFVGGLQDKISRWSPDQTIGEVFKQLVFMFPKFGEYAANYQNAVAAIHECSKENSRFQELAKQIVLTSTVREVTSLEDALFKPVQRLQRNTLVLHDLIKHTPQDHPDYDTLQKALSLSQHNLENFDTSVVGSKAEEKRHLVKSSFLVELVGGWRKLRYIFLFSDVLVCTKREQHRGGKVSFDCKWFIPMNMLRVDTKFSYQDDMKFSKKDDIDDLKKKLRSLKTELKSELKKDEGKDKHWSITGMASSRNIEKLKKKINELEAQLILSSPKLPFKVWHDQGKAHTLLMTTDYEREEWRETITGLRRKSSRGEQPTLSAYNVQEMVNSVKELPQVNKIGTVLTQKDEEAIYGTLNVTIHKMNGLISPYDTYCCLEMDSYGHFFMKARTHICANSADPSWNEDFELELEGSQTLRILCYRKGPDKHGDILLGRGALEMSKEWLRGSFQERTVAMGDYSLVLSVRYTAAEKTMRRTPSKQSTAVFGVKISACARREGKTVPTIVTACIQEVEKRGMEETGIYRVSGVTSDVQRLKKLFDKNVKVGAANLGDMDIHSVTGVIKLYLRELPEPLFTEANYTNFVDALKLSDEEAKEKCMLSLLHNLPDTNYYTIVYLLEHLLKVSKCVAENKMNINNLATIFGPTLLAPATKDTHVSPLEMMSLGAEQAMKQSAIVHYFLSLLVNGCSLRRSAQN